ncbi:hypothetical protein COO60DRAFT_749723 [Scenedesmus sp. NREL 46B-D3]|nr:hypothetical protein COO60DRAFT_749723 [Scenedesmus sp. NREL 46B-D3]
MRSPYVRSLALWAIALLACSGYVLPADGHSHQGCGHTFVADEAKQWADRHSQHLQLRHSSSSNSNSSMAARRLQAVPKVPIRIWVEYQGTEELTAAGRQRLREVVGIAVAVLQKFYKVRWPTAGNLLVPPQCGVTDQAGNCYAHRPDFLPADGGSSSRGRNMCGSAAINSSHIAGYTQCSVQGGCTEFAGGDGEATDYYLYVTARNDEACSSGAAAWALPCLFDDATNRPLLGTANLCRAALEQDADSAAIVLVHELHHALGFTDQLFDKFIDEEGQPIPKEQVVRVSRTPYGELRPVVISPTVAREARAQFGCESVPGAALENEGGSGSALAHWEYKWFQGEVMVATNLYDANGGEGTLSRITLALMQDSGWYDVNWAQAGFLDWGWQAGCDFVGKTCTAYAAAHPTQQYFCTREQYASDSVNTVCTFDGLARAACAKAPFAEGCALKVALGTAPNCLSERFASRAGEIFGWQNGASSRCLPVTLPFATARYRFPGSAAAGAATISDSRCYEMSCTPAGQLQLSILGNKIDCPAGQTVDLAMALPGVFDQGSVGPCPDNAATCGSLACGESCMGNGVCVAGECYCGMMYTGPGCRTRAEPGVVLPVGNGSSAYVPPPDGSVQVPGQRRPGVAGQDGPVVSEAGPGGRSGGSDAGRPGDAEFGTTVQLSLLLDSSLEALRVYSNRFIRAVAQLAGVDARQVTLLPLPAAPGRPTASLTVAPEVQGSVPDNVSDNSTDSRENVASADAGGRRRLAAPTASQADSSALQVDVRIQTSSPTEALAVVSNIESAARQRQFAQQLSEAGLQLVPGSVSWLVSGQGWQAAGSSSGTSSSDGVIRQVQGAAVIAASMAAALLTALAV